MACGFRSHGTDFKTPEGIEHILNIAPFRSLTSTTRSTIYEAPGAIRVQHGQGCAEAPRAASTDDIGFRVQEMAAVPLDYGDAGTVFLNGWELHYNGSDQHVEGLGSTIFNITSGRNGNQFELHWEAGGVLSDQDGAEAYTWCYWYTVLFWRRSSSAFDAVAFDRGTGLTFVQADDADPDQTTAVRALPGGFTDPYGPQAVVPRGFAFTWAGDDHHLLQVGLDLGTPVHTGNDLTWASRTLFKDNDHRREYHGAELVSVLSSRSVQRLHPDTVMRLGANGGTAVANTVPLTPFDGPDAFTTCVGDEPPAAPPLQFRIDNVPFHYAMPVLAGWELSYGCEDHHVKQLGAAITSFRYEREANAATGTLFYTVAASLRDDSQHNGSAAFQVDVVGLNALSSGPHPVLPPPPPPPPTTAVPDVRGDTVAQAAQALQAADLVVGPLHYVVDNTCDAIGAVLSQSPRAGMSQVPQGSAVELWIGQRPPHPCP
jgi:hypothetical protein